MAKNMNPNKKQLSALIPTTLKEWIDQLAMENHMPQSQIVTLTLEAGRDSVDKQFRTHGLKYRKPE